MLRKSVFLPLIVIVLLLSMAPVRAGGWSVVTLDTLPGCVVAEEPLEIGFIVRQHGVQVIYDISPAPTITAYQEESSEQITFTAEEDTPGHYAAELIFPVDGTWEWQLSAYGPEQPMPSLDVVSSGEDCPDETDLADDPETLVELGSDLFLAKGCVVCHQHDDAGLNAFSTINSGPELTEYHNEPDLLCRWLNDPAGAKDGATMPTLGLRSEEIEALISFLNADEDYDIPEAGWCEDVLASAVNE